MLFRSERLRPEDFSTTESSCLLGKAGWRASMPSGNRSPPELLAESVADVTEAIVEAGAVVAADGTDALAAAEGDGF